MKLKVHASPLGVDGCLRRARECMFWPNMASEIKHYIQLVTCAEHVNAANRKSP